MTRYGSHTESRMRENCTYGSMRGRAYPAGASRSTLQSWTPGVSLYKIYIKCALWLNIYEVHLKTGKPMEYYLKRQA
ncbi:MAG: hypothetical protein SPG40_03225 [Kiritimatiellia bacterium]|nr:hypothetical protein [Kiritimatiellia bacterium]